jgi:hypothetical protein
LGGSAGHGPAAAPPKLDLTPATTDEQAAAHDLATGVPFRVYYPVGRVTGEGAPIDETRAYTLAGHPTYVVAVAQGELGQWYDLEGTTWQSPPILKDPNQTIQLAGRKVQLYYEGQRLRVVAWRDGTAVYWLVNSLQNILTNRQMLAIAAAARPVS